MAKDKLRKEWEALDEAFPEINLRHSQALHADEMTDELELEFLRAQRDLAAAYAAMFDAEAAKAGDE